ncbi:hypothetical protein [Nitrosopumilus sp.]|uniref:hypothetical protein n=1 Tax=Nitrosopumilus sp. TaxID=2024843 RepID=UPI002628F489|nr:hypothetical protein [Nitrosopumilus sp.]
MFSKSLVIFAAIGVMAGLGYGIYLIDFKTTSQLTYVEGSSISIVTEKFDFKLGEEINIRIINSGTIPIKFSDMSYGLRITGLSGILMYSPVAAQAESTLVPGDEVEFSWDQIKNDGDVALEGLYKISAKGFDEQGNTIEKSTTITLWK